MSEEIYYHSYFLTEFESDDHSILIKTYCSNLYSDVLSALKKLNFRSTTDSYCTYEGQIYVIYIHHSGDVKNFNKLRVYLRAFAYDLAVKYHGIYNDNWNRSCNAEEKLFNGYYSGQYAGWQDERDGSRDW